VPSIGNTVPSSPWIEKLLLVDPKLASGGTQGLLKTYPLNCVYGLIPPLTGRTTCEANDGKSKGGQVLQSSMDFVISFLGHTSYEKGQYLKNRSFRRVIVATDFSH
jgi:hypothetical protein